MTISSSPILRYISLAFATIFVGFGINAMLNPTSALTFFELSYPIPPDQQKLVNALLLVYGARDIFMGAAIYISALYGNTTALGCMVLAAGLTAGADGWACKYIVGAGEMNHWGYAPILLVLGAVMAAGV
ncbi:hypothetical protein AC578_9940 [Pseudocercospora eumusae]|uniref:Uncharacterized protein n=1 Tax=Pseudocercospora eumusae TaxID=321146 RepID=A0A139HAZ0_9PEZI|nr:hypothetical protein AC578_9940 [Pseudocercospora eumusae]